MLYTHLWIKMYGALRFYITLFIIYRRKGFIMWIANGWNDYEVIDTSGGEKLERWGKYILLRPDPQVIWNTPKKDKNWKKLIRKQSVRLVEFLVFLQVI